MQQYNYTEMESVTVSVDNDDSSIRMDFKSGEIYLSFDYKRVSIIFE